MSSLLQPKKQKTAPTVISHHLSNDEWRLILEFMDDFADVLNFGQVCKRFHEVLITYARELTPVVLKEPWTPAKALFQADGVEVTAKTLESQLAFIEKHQMLSSVNLKFTDMKLHSVYKLLKQKQRMEKGGKEEIRLTKQVQVICLPKNMTADSDQSEVEFGTKYKEYKRPPIGFTVRSLNLSHVTKMTNNQFLKLLSCLHQVRYITNSGDIGRIFNLESHKDRPPKQIPVMPRLKHVATEVDEVVLRVLLRCAPKLKSLMYYAKSHVQSSFLTALTGCSHLSQLSITTFTINNGITDADLLLFLEKMPSITKLVLIGFSSLSGSFLLEIHKYAPQLEHLEVTRCHGSNLAPECPEIYIAGKMANLHTIVMDSGWSNISLKMGEAFRCHLPKLHTCNLKSIMSDEINIKLAEHCSRLKSFVIQARCTATLLRKLCQLSHLSHITIRERIKKFCNCSWPHVRSLTVDDSDLDAEVCLRLLKACPSLQSLTINTTVNLHHIKKILDDLSNWPDLREVQLSGMARSTHSREDAVNITRDELWKPVDQL